MVLFKWGSHFRYPDLFKGRKVIKLNLQASKYRVNNLFGSAEVPWTSVLRSRFIGSHRIFWWSNIFFALKLSKNSVSHCIKSVHVWSFSGPCFPAFGLTTERYSVYSCYGRAAVQNWTKLGIRWTKKEKK